MGVGGGGGPWQVRQLDENRLLMTKFPADPETKVRGAPAI